MLDRHLDDYKNAIERGVKIRHSEDIPEGAEMPQIIQTLIETGSFEVKSAPIPKAGISIFDKKRFI